MSFVETPAEKTDPAVESAAGDRRMQWLSRAAAESFYVDLRSLAALRICLGALLIADCITRAVDLEAHYTDLGVAPRDVVLAESGWRVYCSLHWWLAGSTIGEAAAFTATGLCALAFLLGWHTRIMTIACWYLQASLMIRMPLITSAGDRTLQLLLFWLILLPAGARWSLDARRRPDLGQVSNRYVSLAGFGVLMQVCAIYWFSVVFKLATPMWREGRAVEFALKVDPFATEFAQWLLQFQTLLPLMTMAVLAWELLGPCLPFIPRFHTPGRILAVAGFWMLHAGFALALRLGIFAWISIASWLIFIPSAVWDRLLPDSATRGEPLQPRRWQTTLAAVSLALVVLLNIHSVSLLQPLVPKAVVRVGNALRLRQGWAMFTHEQEGTGGWFVVQGVLADGRELDLAPGAGGPLSWDEPDLPSRQYGSARWAQTLHRYHEMEHSPYWEPYSAYLCRAWNRDHGSDERLERVIVWFMQRQTDFFGDETIVPVQLHEHDCAAGP